MKQIVGDDDGFASRMRRARERTGLSQREAQIRGVVSASTISRIEMGTRFPSEYVLRQLAERYGTTALELETGNHGRCPHCGRGP